MEVAQTLCIWAADVDCKIVGLISQRAETGQIIIYGLIYWRIFSLTNIYAYGHFAFTFRVILGERVEHRFRTFVIKAHTVDKRFAFWVAKKPWAWIARLSFWCHCANLGMAKA